MRLVALLTVTITIAGCAHSLQKQEPHIDSSTDINSDVRRNGSWTFDPREFLSFTEDYPRDGTVLGQGWDAYLGRKTSAICVEGESSHLLGESATINFSEIRDRENFFSSMNMSASAKFSAGAASGRASVSFARSVQFDNEALNILVSARADKGGIQLVPTGSGGGVLPDDKRPVAYSRIQLNKAARDLLSTPAGAKEFVRRCGDAFVVSIRSGGRLDALFRYRLDNTQTKEQLAASASGSYISASGSVDFNSETRTQASKRKVDVNYSQVGGDLSSMPLDAAALLDKIKGWASFPVSQAEPYVVYLVSYRNLDSWPLNAATAGLGMPSREIQDYASHYWRYIDLSGRYSQASANPDSAYNLFDRDLEADADLMRSAASCIDTAMAVCARDRTCSIEGLAKQPENLVDCRAVDKRLPYSDDARQVIFASAFSTKITLNVLDEYKAIAKRAWSSLDSAATNDKVYKVDEFDKDRSSKSAFWNYYMWLAVSPLNRTVPYGSADEKDTGDGVNAIIEYSKNGRAQCVHHINKTPQPCASLSRQSLNKYDGQSQQFKDDAKRIAREWVLNKRLKPLSDLFCRDHVKHPMCFEMSELRAIADRTKVEFKKIDIGNPPPPPAPVEPPPSEPRERYPLKDPCRRPGTYLC